MNIVPCEQNKELREKIIDFAETLRAEAHLLGNHGLSESDFHNSGLFRGAIERIRGQYSAAMKEKRDFVRAVLNYMKHGGFIEGWESAGESNRHDYLVTLKSGRRSVIELKGCLDGNNTNIFERPPHANEFIVWSVCTNPGADPRHNVWSGIHTRLSAEIIHRGQVVDGLVVWDMVCGTIGRPCPKISEDKSRISTVGSYKLPPPCIYLFPDTIPSTRNNPHPSAQKLESVEFLASLNECFRGRKEEVYSVSIAVEHRGAELVRTTRISRSGELVRESEPTPIQRA